MVSQNDSHSCSFDFEKKQESVREILVSEKRKHTQVLLFHFRLGFSSIGTSVEVAWKASSGRSVVVDVMFVGKMRCLLSMHLPARHPLEPMTSVLTCELINVDDELAAVV